MDRSNRIQDIPASWKIGKYIMAAWILMEKHYSRPKAIYEVILDK